MEKKLQVNEAVDKLIQDKIASGSLDPKSTDIEALKGILIDKLSTQKSLKPPMSMGDMVGEKAGNVISSTAKAIPQVLKQVGTDVADFAVSTGSNIKEDVKEGDYARVAFDATNAAAKVADVPFVSPVVAADIAAEKVESTSGKVIKYAKEHPFMLAFAISELPLAIGTAGLTSIAARAGRKLINPVVEFMRGPISQTSGERLANAAYKIRTGSPFIKQNMETIGNLIKNELSFNFATKEFKMTGMQYVTPDEFSDVAEFVLKELGNSVPKNLAERKDVRDLVGKVTEQVRTREAKAQRYIDSGDTIQEAMGKVWKEEGHYRPDLSAKDTMPDTSLGTKFSSAQYPIRTLFDKVFLDAGYIPVSPVSDAMNYLQSSVRVVQENFQARVIPSVKKELVDVATIYAKSFKNPEEVLEELGKYAMAVDYNARMKALSTSVQNLKRGRAGEELLVGGLSAKDAMDALIRADNVGYASKFDEILKEVYKLNSDGLDLLVKHGFVTKETANAWRTKYGPTWMPYRGLPGSEELSGDIISGLNLMPKSPYTPMAQGRFTLPDNPVLGSIIYYQGILAQIQKNHAMKTIAETFRQYPFTGVATVKPAKAIEVEASKPGFIATHKDPLKANELRFWEDGKEWRIEFNVTDENPQYQVVVDAIKGTNRDVSSAIGESTSLMATTLQELYGASKKFNRIASGAATTWSAAFGISNALQDAFQAVSLVKGELNGKLAMDTIKNIPQSWMASMGKGSPEWIKIAKEFDLAGIGGFTSGDLYNTVKKLETSLEADLKAAITTGDKGAFNKVKEGFLAYQKMMEIGTRRAVYKACLDNGLNRLTSFNYAKRITLDFLDKGTYGSFINGLYMFATANTKGVERFATSLRNPKVRDLAYKIMMTSFYHHEFSRLIAGTNDAGVNYMDMSPSYERDRYILFAIPGQEPIKTPGFRGFNIFWSAGRLFSDILHYKETGMTVPRAVMNQMSTTLNSFLPVGRYNLGEGNSIGEVIHSLTPPLITYVGGIPLNMDKWGKPMRPDSLGLNQFNTRITTDKFYKDVAEAIHNITYKVLGVGFDWNPEAIEYTTIDNPLLPGTIADLGRAATEYFDTTKTTDLSKYPGISRFKTPGEAYTLPPMFFKMKQEIQNLVKTYNQQIEVGRFAEAEQLWLERGAEISLALSTKTMKHYGIATKLGRITENMERYSKILKSPDYTRHPPEERQWAREQLINEQKSWLWHVKEARAMQDKEVTKPPSLPSGTLIRPSLPQTY